MYKIYNKVVESIHQIFDWDDDSRMVEIYRKPCLPISGEELNALCQNDWFWRGTWEVDSLITEAVSDFVGAEVGRKTTSPSMGGKPHFNPTTYYYLVVQPFGHGWGYRWYRAEGYTPD